MMFTDLDQNYIECDTCHTILCVNSDDAWELGWREYYFDPENYPMDKEWICPHCIWEENEH